MKKSDINQAAPCQCQRAAQAIDQGHYAELIKGHATLHTGRY